jgi:hypothetical protein
MIVQRHEEKISYINESGIQSPDSFVIFLADTLKVEIKIKSFQQNEIFLNQNSLTIPFNPFNYANWT